MEVKSLNNLEVSFWYLQFFQKNEPVYCSRLYDMCKIMKFFKLCLKFRKLKYFISTGPTNWEHAISMKLCMCKDFCNMYNQPPYCTTLHRFLQSKNEKECQKRPWKIPSRQSIINKQYRKLFFQTKH